MPANHTDVDQFTTVVEASDGDPVDQVAWRAADGPLADRTHFLKKRTYAGEASDEFPVSMAPFGNDQSKWVNSLSPIAWQQSDVASAFYIVFEAQPLPKNGKIVQVVAKLKGATVARAGLPATMPRLRLLRQDTGSTSAPTTVADVTDTSGSVGAYEALHTITLPSLTEVIAHDAGFKYYLRFDGETDPGTNDSAGLELYGITVHVSPS